MREEPRSPGSLRFWAHVVAVGGLHVWLLTLATGWSRGCASARGSLAGGDSGAALTDEVTWVDPSVFAAAFEAPRSPRLLPESPTEPAVEENVKVRDEVDELIESELKLPPPPKKVEKPKPKPTPKARPNPPKEKEKTKPTPRKEVKEVAKKTEPKSAPRPRSASAVKKPERTVKANVEKKKTEKPKEKDATKEAFLAAKSGKKKSAGGGTGSASGAGTGGGSGDDGALARYHAHIQRRFYQRWAQPTSVFTNRSKFVTTVEITIQKGGSISAVRMVKSSGNPVVDESVMLAAQSVTQIDPLPSAVPKVPYVVEIDFELN